MRASGETGTENPYASWTHARALAYHREGVARIQEKIADNECINGSIDRKTLKSAEWRLAIDVNASAKDLESAIHAVERVIAQKVGEQAQYIPIRFIHTNKLNRDDRLTLAFDGLVLSETLGRKVDIGKIVHGDSFTTLRVKTSTLEGEVRKAVAEIAGLLACQTPPDLVLTQHCAECEFQKQCRQKAIEKDDLSLLAGITVKARPGTSPDAPLCQNVTHVEREPVAANCDLQRDRLACRAQRPTQACAPVNHLVVTARG
jgi:predicted RecB family nuclease